MSIRKVLVEFELDPTDYAGQSDGEELGSMPDTQEGARTLVQGMFEGDVDICNAKMVGDLVLLFRGKVKPNPAERHLSHLDSLNAIIGTLQRFHQEKPFQSLKDSISITCLPPTPERAYYEVSVWRQPLPVVVSNGR